MFITHNQVRMHDTDMAGILYFARQFRFAHDGLEDFVESLGYTFDQIFREEEFVFVIVHAEADYFTTLRVGDKLQIKIVIEKIGETSFTVVYHIYKIDGTLAGKVRTVHVTLASDSRKKMEIPEKFRKLLENHLETFESRSA